MSAQNIQFTPPKAEGKTGDDLTRHVDQMHQLIFNKLQNHFEAISALNTRIAALEAEQKK
jgi:hypothetical protein